MSSTEAEFYENMTDRDEYRGQWIAILGDRVVASGKNAGDVYAEAAKRANGRTPLLVAIPDNDDAEFLSVKTD